MLAQLFVSSSPNKIKEEISKTLTAHLTGKNNHPDLLYIKTGEKLGIAEAKKIKEHFSLKPYSAKGRVVILENATDLTTEAQNALLKTIEELPKEATLILGTSSTANLLPTVLSRCKITKLEDKNERDQSKHIKDLENLLNATTLERFEYIEKLKDKKGFLNFMTYAFRQMLHAPKPILAKIEIVIFLKELLQAEQWAKQNVNIRGILEYLMLIMPKQSQSSNVKTQN